MKAPERCSYQHTAFSLRMTNTLCTRGYNFCVHVFCICEAGAAVGFAPMTRLQDSRTSFSVFLYVLVLVLSHLFYDAGSPVQPSPYFLCLSSLRHYRVLYHDSLVDLI